MPIDVPGIAHVYISRVDETPEDTWNTAVPFRRTRNKDFFLFLITGRKIKVAKHSLITIIQIKKCVFDHYFNSFFFSFFFSKPQTTVLIVLKFIIHIRNRSVFQAAELLPRITSHTHTHTHTHPLGFHSRRAEKPRPEDGRLNTPPGALQTRLSCGHGTHSSSLQ